MKTAAIITEYNPFHNGHEYQIKKIREILGNDTAIIAIMSGNFTQRAEPAVTDKSYRAKAAVECGVNLVLELPFPYSMSSAEFFAKSGVKIAEDLGVVDYLVFGSECGSADILYSVAKSMLSNDFIEAVKLEEQQNPQIGYPAICESVYKKLCDKDFNHAIFTPNNILGIEYIKALITFNSKIIPITIKREGGEYNSLYTEGSKLQSATAIRKMISQNINSAFDFVPKSAKKIYIEAIQNSHMPTDYSNLDSAVISHFRLNTPTAECDIHDAGGGLYNRLHENSMTVSTINSLVSLTETKKYTKARIRRAIWNSYFGVTSSAVKELPSYTQVLAMDQVGRLLLKEIKKVAGLSVITKPSSYRDRSPSVIKQKELSNKADAMFDLTLKMPISGRFSLTFTPYVKKT